MRLYGRGPIFEGGYMKLFVIIFKNEISVHKPIFDTVQNSLVDIGQ